MDLRDYPRPKDDTGIGVHWNAGFAAAIGLGQIEQIWLPRLREMGVKWVKIADHDGALGFAELLLKNDIMPIVRIYRPQPNPGTLSASELAAVSDFVSAGVRYFEFNNEPDMGVEWRGGEVPLDALTIVARHAITDMEAILQRGGYPGIPAVLPGSRWNLVGEICRLGRRDLLSQPVWQAIHNYSANHPLDYPYDRVNQEGAPCSRELYNRLALERWNGDAWEGWTLEQVNRFRKERANPGATAISDPTCWRAYERFDYLIRREIGRSLPILATENGYVVGERQDKRYPATTPQLHAIQTLEACRIMMGTSKLYEPAPDYYFCTAFWLLGNFTLGSWAPAWENAAWFSHNWPGGQLPIVNALMAEPKQARAWRGDAGRPGRLTGTIRRGPPFPLTLRLVRDDGWLAVTQSRADGRFELVDLPFDHYVLTIVEAGVSQEVAITEGQPAVEVEFDLSAATVRLANGSIKGRVRGGAGKVVLLTRETGNPYEAKQLVAADNTYRFSELEPGMYTIRLADSGVVKSGIAVDGQSEVTVDLAVPGWGWQASDGGASPGFGVVRVRVTGRTGLPVRLWTTGWSGMTQRTGSKPEYGPDACEFAPLGAGTYKVQPEGIAAVAEVKVDGSRVVWITFVENVPAAVAPHESVLSGRVRTAAGAPVAGRPVKLWGPEGEQATTTQEDGAYRFEKLGPGIYRVGVEGTDVVKDRIELDGRNAATVDLELPAPAASAIFGVIT
ncbi:MAG: carboxypeptidase-like regulatory domain-containing protein, partial [Anaerolineae bacterium]